MGYLLGIDLGTSSVRVMLVDDYGKILGVAGQEYPVVSPRLGWAEQDPGVWWRATCDSIKELLKTSGVGKHDVDAVGLSGQMHGLALVDNSGSPIRPAIIWPDKRTVEECREISNAVNPADLCGITGLPIATGFYGPSLLWVQKHEPRNYEQAHKALLPKDYIRYKLTGEMATDPTDACGTLLFDVRSRAWSSRVVQSLGLRSDLLPEIMESTDVVGKITADAAVDCGLSTGVAVAAGGGDQAMAALGLGVGEGEVTCTIGTGGQVVTVTPRVVIDPLRRVHTLCHIKPNTWLVMGAVLAAGLSLRWFRDNLADSEATVGRLAGMSSYELLATEAARVAPSSDGLIFLPYLSGERTPHMDPKARGCFVGLTLSHTKAHMIRAIMEGVGFAMKDSLSLLGELGMPVENIILSGGGAKSPTWRRIQADIYGLPVRTVRREEHSVYGAALAAGVASGAYSDVMEAAAIARSESKENGETIVPDKDKVALYERHYEIFRSLYPALRDMFEKLAEQDV